MTDYAKIGQEIGELVKTKQAAYGDSFGKAGAVMLQLYPDGIPKEKMDDALTIIRIVDKLFRIATKKDALGENPYRDIAGYALLAVGRDEDKIVKMPRLEVEDIHPPRPSRCMYHNEKNEPTCRICKIVNAEQIST